MIEVKNLVKRYGKFTAVNDISFTLEPGKIYGFLGPNGAGKSTTMNIMTGYIAATSGDVVINDCNILEDPEEAKSQIGYLPEIPPVYTEMTVEEYIKFVAKLKQIPKADRKNEVERVIAKTHLNEYRRRLIGNLSKGYRQRVGLAQAIIGNPKFIILDEPTVGLDPRQILEIRCLIKELVSGNSEEEDAEKPTLILSSHIMQEVSAVCDEIIMIARGRLIARGTPDELVDQFHTHEKIEVTARTDAETLREILLHCNDNMEITFIQDAQEGFSHAIVTLEKGQDIRADIFTEMSKAGIVMTSLHRIVPSLEDIFLDLVHKADEEAARQEEEQAAQERINMLLKAAKKEGIENVEGVSFEELEAMVFPELSQDASLEEDDEDEENEDVMNNEEEKEE